MSQTLLIINAGNCMEVQFDQQLTIGRDVFNSLSLQDPEISRSHAIIFEQGDQMIVKDLNSRNGIYVRGERVKETVLAPNDELIMGMTVMVYDPTGSMDLGVVLSKRGKYLVEKRSKKIEIEPPKPPTSFPVAELDRSIDGMLSDPVSNTFFSMQNALMVLRALREMDQAASIEELFDVTMHHAITELGGHRGVIMESDSSRQKLKVRAIQTIDDSDTVLIAQPILRQVLSQGQAVFCSNIVRDRRFEKLAAQVDRPIHSFAAAPVISAGETFGLIYLESQDSSIVYFYETLRTLYLLASHLGALMRERPKHFSPSGTTQHRPQPAPAP